MIKKKLSILLLLLLAVLFIGLFSTSYARTLTATEIMNFTLNGYQYKLNSVPSQTIIDNVKAQEQGFEVWAELTETYEGQYALAFNGYGVSFYYYNGSQANLNNYSPYYYSNAVNVNTSYLTRKRADYNVNENQFYDFSNSNLGLGASNRFFYTDFNIKTNANNAYPGGANLYSAGTSLPDSNIFAENFISSDKFEFSPILSYFQVCSINGLTQPSEVYVLERPTYDYVTLGYLEKFSNLDNISITRYRYNRANGWTKASEYATNDFTGYNVQDDILTYTIDISKIESDTLVLFNFTPNNIEDFSNQTFALYIKSPYTYISNNIIYPGQTFSGDYYNNYNDNTNTDKIVDNNNEDTEGIKDFLKETYDKMFTVSGEEINSIVTNAISKINIESGELIETTIILDYLNRQPGDFVISWNDMTTHFSIQNQQLDNQLTIPTRQINFSELERNSLELQEVMRWERIIINIGIFSILLHEIYILFLKTIGVGIDIYGDKQEEKATLKAAQQREKATIRRQMFNANQERLREYEKMARKKGWKK